MSFDPFEIEGLNLKRSLHGYDRDEVDRLLQGLAARHADVLRRHAEVREQLERLEGEVVRYREEKAGGREGAHRRAARRRGDQRSRPG